MNHGGSETTVPIRLALTSSVTKQPDPPARSRRLLLTVVIASALLMALAFSPLIDAVPTKLAIAFTALAASVGTWLASKRRASSEPASQEQPSCLIVDDRCVRLNRPDKPDKTLFTLSPGFGLTLLTTVDRSRLALALTSPQGLLCVGADVGPVDRKRFEMLMPHAVTVGRDELAMALHSPGGERLVVESTSLMRLLDILTQLDATSLGRLILTDHQGRDVRLERDRLTTPLGTIRLDQPFEWRGLRFREGAGSWDADFQATWVRQGMQEIVLVSLLGGDIRDSLLEVKHRGVRPDAMLRQDARLTHGTRALPPPVEQRVAVDRLFMLAFRRALDSAHVDTRDSIPGGASLR